MLRALSHLSNWSRRFKAITSAGIWHVKIYSQVSTMSIIHLKYLTHSIAILYWRKKDTEHSMHSMTHLIHVCACWYDFQYVVSLMSSFHIISIIASSLTLPNYIEEKLQRLQNCAAQWAMKCCDNHYNFRNVALICFTYIHWPCSMRSFSICVKCAMVHAY